MQKNSKSFNKLRKNPEASEKIPKAGKNDKGFGRIVMKLGKINVDCKKFFK